MMPCNHGPKGSVDDLCVLCVPAHVLIERLRERCKMLESDLAAAIVSEREAEERAAAADVIVLPVEGEDALPGEIDVFSDGHSHHYVPTSILHGYAPIELVELKDTLIAKLVAEKEAAQAAVDKLTVVPLESFLEQMKPE
jgi:hypothetical protein